MNFNTVKQELHKKIKKMSEEDFVKFINELKRIYYKAHNIHLLKKENDKKVSDMADGEYNI